MFAFTQQPDGTFVDMPIGTAADVTTIAVADLDGDGLLDVVSGSRVVAGTTGWHRNTDTGDIALIEAAATSLVKVDAADINNGGLCGVCCFMLCRCAGCVTLLVFPSAPPQTAPPTSLRRMSLGACFGCVFGVQIFLFWYGLCAHPRRY